MTKTCLRCIAFFEGEVCGICGDPNADYHKKIENYKGYNILRYKVEDGYRVDFGTKRSKLVDTIEEAKELVDYKES